MVQNTFTMNYFVVELFGTSELCNSSQWNDSELKLCFIEYFKFVWTVDELLVRSATT